MQVTYITPDSPQELSKYYQVLHFLHAFTPRDYELDLKNFINETAGHTTLVYSGKLPIGCFTLFPLEEGPQRMVEIHGVYRQDLKMLLGRAAAKALMDDIFTMILCTAFMDTGYGKVIGKVTAGARLARVWLKKFGFHQVPSLEPNIGQWELTRKEYLGVVEV